MPSSTASSWKYTHDVMNRLRTNVKLLKETQLCPGCGEAEGEAGEGAALGAETQVHRGFWTISELLGCDSIPPNRGQSHHPGAIRSTAGTR